MVAANKPPERGYNSELPSGYDVRDVLTTDSRGLGDRVRALQGLLVAIQPIPSDALSGRQGASGSDSSNEGGLECAPCSKYKVVQTAWRKALKWTDGLDHGLAVMLASVASTKTVGDQLWFKILGPASCGKSTLAEAISVNKEYVFAKSSIRGFHSGYKLDGKKGGGGEDHGLIPKIDGKTLVTKDGDTLLQAPNLPQILAEGRDLYDGTARSHYRNAMSKDYIGVRLTWLLCGTSSLRSIDSSELGERFLDCVIMEKIDDELEDEVLWRVANRAERNVAIESDGDAKSQYEPELAEAMSLTGGYVGWLRENAADGMSAIETPVWAVRRCTRLGKFVAHMRARPSVHQEESAEREFAARLVSQLVRLAKCLALVLNCSRVDATVMKRVTRVALDTSRGQTLAIVSHLYEEPEGLEVKGITLKMTFAEHRIWSLLRFLRQIGVVDHFQVKHKGFRSAKRWGLTQRMRELYELVVEKGVE